MIPADRHPDPRRPAEPDLREVAARLAAEEETIRQGGGPKAIARQHDKGRQTARERIDGPDRSRFALPRARACGPATRCTRSGAGPRPRASSPASAGSPGGGSMIIANDATVKAGAFFPMTIKKVLRAQRDRRGEPPAAGLPRRFRRASSCRCRTRSSPTRTTSAASSATTPSSRPRASRRSRRSWATASPAAATCRCCATSC